MEIRSGTLTALYLFDVAESIDLARLRELVGSGSATRLPSKSTTPARLHYQVAPLVVDGESAGIGSIEDFQARLKVFDYGVISLALSRECSGTWADLVDVSQRYIENAALEARAEDAVRALAGRCERALTRGRPAYLSEDYLVIALHTVDGIPTADALIAGHGAQLAQLLRGETQPLSAQEQEEVLRNRISYFTSDLVVPTWNAAFLYDTPSAAAELLELFEFANSQLLEYRYYDALLDGELGHLYPALQRTNWWRNLLGGGAVKAANQVHSLLIDVNEITDRTENALKIVGDIYAARVLALVSARLALGRWKQSVEEKL